MTLRLSTGLEARVGVDVRRNDDQTQWVGNFQGDEGVTHYTFARLEQRTVSFDLRVNYTATRDLTFEFYGEPFVSRGRYSDFREVSATPYADTYGGRFVPFTPPPSVDSSFRFRQLRTNAVARWEYLPGSTLFVVWAHGRQGSDAGPDARSWAGEYRDLFRLHPDNTFLIKVAYWFNR